MLKIMRIQAWLKLAALLLVFSSYSLNAGSEFSGERLKEACLNYIYEKAGDGAEVTLSQTIDNQSFDIDGVTAKCDASKESLRGNCYIAIEFYHEKRLLRRIQAPVRVKIYKEIAVAKSSIKSKSVIKEGDIAYEKKDVTYYGSSELPDAKKIIGSTAKRNISGGAIITKSLLEEDIIIHRGEKVLIIVQSGAVRIRAYGTALQDAAMGAEIRVKRENSSSVLHGRVATDGTIYVASM